MKFSFYTIFTPNKVDKIAKWKNKFNERAQNFLSTKRRLSFLLSIHTNIQIWINSTQFKTQYIDTKHPNPPLLNPSDIDYTKICADYAWKFNLPLPPCYDLILISGSNHGHNAILDFFEKCGAKRGQDHLPKDLKVIYTNFYEFLMNTKNANDFKILPFVQYDYLDYTKSEFQRYCDFFMHKTPILVQVRDPFIKLLIVNNCWQKPNAIWEFGLNDNLPEILDRMFYMFDGNLENAFEYLITLPSFRQSSAIKGLGCIENIDFVDTDKELMPNNAYETMKKLAKKYKLKEPQDRRFFEGIMEEDVFGLLPLTLQISLEDACIYLDKAKSHHFDDKYKVDILITLYQWQRNTNFVDISNEIWGSSWLYKGSDIRLYVKKDEYECYFDETMKEAAIKYFQYFKQEFMKRVELENAKKFTIEDILSYLQKDKALSEKLKKLLDQELDVIKQMRPDIVKSWVYYQRFEKFMAEHNSQQKDTK